MRTRIVDSGIVYDDQVNRGYQFDPLKHDLIYGEQLENGMVVIQQKDSSNLISETNEYEMVNRRWCEVTALRDRTLHNGTHSVFIGVYADGSKMVRYSGQFEGWIVRKSYDENNVS